MSVIQSGSDWWINSVARFPGGLIGGDLPGGAMNKTAIPTVDSYDANASGNISSAISDAEEEGEISPAYEDTSTHAAPMALTAKAIDSKSTEMGVSEEIVAAAAMHIGVIEAAMRQHQATGVVNFDDDEAHSGNQDPGDSSFNGSFLTDLLQNPNAAFAAASPALDRIGLLSLLGN